MPPRADDGAATGNPPTRIRNVGYETFIVLLSIQSLINLALLLMLRSQQTREVILIVDGVLCLIFVGDFIYRFATATSKRGYMTKDGGWLDLIGSLPIPGLRIARVFRLARVGAALRRYGLRRFWRDYRQQRAANTLLTVIFLIIVIVQYVSMSILYAERGAPGANIRTASDALWWALVTIATVGYGDRYPVTNAGRIIGVFLLCGGVGLFSVVTGFLANSFVRSKEHGGTDIPSVDLAAELAEIKRLLHELQERSAPPSLPDNQTEDREHSAATRT
jgi:voltage-gated potassium channel